MNTRGILTLHPIPLCYSGVPKPSDFVERDRHNCFPFILQLLVIFGSESIGLFQIKATVPEKRGWKSDEACQLLASDLEAFSRPPSLLPFSFSAVS